jgi:DNA replication protein DnaC
MGRKLMSIKDFSNSEARFTAVWASCGIPPRLSNASFANYEPACPEKEQALKKCQAFVQKGLDLIKQGNGLFFQGPVGTGKSHLAVASLRAILQNNLDRFGTPSSDNDVWGEPVYDGFCCSMISVVDLLNTLRESFNTDNSRVTARRILHRARTDSIVILDDIGAEKPSEWVEEQLYALIDLRYRMQRSTFFTTNCTLKQLEGQIGSRSVSRITEMCEGVRVGGEDCRKRGINSVKSKRISLT